MIQLITLLSRMASCRPLMPWALAISAFLFNVDGRRELAFERLTGVSAIRAALGSPRSVAMDRPYLQELGDAAIN